MASQPNPTRTLTQTAEAPGEFLWNDSGNADQLALMYGRDLLYCVERKAYYTWDGARWMYDDFRTVEGMAERTLLYMRAHAAKIELAQRILVRALTLAAAGTPQRVPALPASPFSSKAGALIDA